jgi:hydroxypyruvate reductase
MQILSDIYASISADELLSPHLQSIEADFTAIIAIGKASNEMAKATVEHFGSRPTLIICPLHTHDYHLPQTTRIISSHPFVDTQSLYAGDILEEFVIQRTGEKLLFLISGGGSALVEKLGNITLPVYQDLLLRLMTCGADINELNTVRKHLSRIKGGHLLRYISPQSSVFILSDIVDDSYHNVSSGITFCDHSTISDAVSILKKYQIVDFDGGFFTEPPQGYPSLSYITIATNATMLKNIKAICEKNQIQTIISDYRLRERASITGLNIGCQILNKSQSISRPAAIVYGGETSVDIRGDGIGGRALELALAIAIEISGLDGVSVISSASDGRDGSANATGVMIDGTTYQKMITKGKNPHEMLRYNDSFTALHDCAEIIPMQKSTSNLCDFLLVIYH